MDSQAATTPTWPICSYWTRKRALHQGRFRETVLFCWSTIDSVFNRRYGALVDAALLDEWGEARDFFKGLDFKLRNKMSAGMHLVANQSLFREPGDFWHACLPVTASATPQFIAERMPARTRPRRPLLSPGR